MYRCRLVPNDVGSLVVIKRSCNFENFPVCTFLTTTLQSRIGNFSGCALRELIVELNLFELSWTSLFFDCRRSRTNVLCVPSRFLLPETSRVTCTCTVDRGRTNATCVAEDSASKPTSRTTCSYIPVRFAVSFLCFSSDYWRCFNEFDMNGSCAGNSVTMLSQIATFYAKRTS